MILLMKGKTLHRYLERHIKEDLRAKMVFVGGPRQVGKTTLALSLLGTRSGLHPAYVNWDDPTTHAPLLKSQLPGNQKLIVLDEIHKYARWRNLIKGFYDKYKERISFLVSEALLRISL